MKFNHSCGLVVAMFAAMLFFGENGANAQGYVEIGDGDYKNIFIPVSSHLTNSATQQVYLASEIGNTSMYINAIAFHYTPYSSDPQATTRDIKVFLSTTTESTITQESGWLPVPVSNLYYSGTFDLPGTQDEWVTINLARSFEYDGYSNLVVTVIDNTGQAASGGLHAFYGSLYDDDNARAMIATNTGADYYGAALDQSEPGIPFNCRVNIRLYGTHVGVSTTKKWFGFVTSSASSDVTSPSFIEFTMQDTEHPIERASFSDLLVSAAEYVDRTLYFVSWDKRLYKAPFPQGNISLDNYETVAELQYTPYDMSYNPVNHTMYYMANAGNRKLYSLNLQNGELTEIGTQERTVKTLAINISGEAYAIDEEGYLNRVNLDNASLTRIGYTGLDATYGWTMAFDRATGELFWNQYGENGDCGIYRVNTLTGAATLVGHIGTDNRSVNLHGLFCVDASSVDVNPALTVEAAVYPNPAGDKVFVDAQGLQRVEVLDIDGRTLIETHERCIDISALPAGLYLLRITSTDGTVVRKVVKKSL